jgi:Ser/Thr protein kinase RdoA (MazF antagonist)
VISARRFDELSVRGRSGRLRIVALEALRDYDIDVKRCSFVARAFNTVFRVDGANGSAHALRVSPDLRIHADGCEEAEAAWVAALRRDAGLPVPQVIASRAGSVVTWVSVPEVPGLRSCVLFEWVGGRRLRECMSADLVRKTGALMAIVHDQASVYASAPVSGALVADRVLYFRAPRRLAELRPTYGSLLDDAVDRAQRVLDDLWRSPPHRPHLLHGDVQPGNVLVARSAAVTLIDFQDLIWGFEVQDASIALHALGRFDDAPGLMADFRDGYSSVRTWPEADADTAAGLRAARHLNVLNLGLNVRGPGLDEFIARHAAPVVEWMRPPD